MKVFASPGLQVQFATASGFKDERSLACQGFMDGLDPLGLYRHFCGECKSKLGIDRRHFSLVGCLAWSCYSRLSNRFSSWSSQRHFRRRCLGYCLAFFDPFCSAAFIALDWGNPFLSGLAA
jgi:hypothetical protein